ncbi:hypothetical protein RT97_12885 [Variovorax paradoxus]|uniref:Lipoprotein n=1 Tax=Variovorax paradoxus TaxID=34073 RepID=A0A0D0MM11_VARPD|nr:hypothetical protein [Variovorax paradoxus]KIQ31964.1 hypothetical protein RT97_12885 [Variovorax paradoxus]
MHRLPCSRQPALIAAVFCAAAIAVGCAHAPKPEPVAPAVTPAAAAPAPAAIGPFSVTAVLAVYRTQVAERGTRERCGVQIAPPPKASLWSRMFSSEPTGEGDIPPPSFVPETACDTVAAQRLQAARYRVTYRFEGEEYNVDLGYDPGAALRLDSLGHVVGPALLP